MRVQAGVNARPGQYIQPGGEQREAEQREEGRTATAGLGGAWGARESAGQTRAPWASQSGEGAAEARRAFTYIVSRYLHNSMYCSLSCLQHLS